MAILLFVRCLFDLSIRYSFENERLHEVNELLVEGRDETIQFTGIYMEVNGVTYVSGIHVVILDTSILPAEPLLNGVAVVVTGYTNAEGFVDVESIELLPAGTVVPQGPPVEVEDNNDNSDVSNGNENDNDHADNENNENTNVNNNEDVNSNDSNVNDNENSNSNEDETDNDNSNVNNDDDNSNDNSNDDSNDNSDDNDDSSDDNSDDSSNDGGGDD